MGDLPNPPVISSLVPNTAQQGQGISVTVSGQNTHFAQNTTQLSFGAGVVVTNVSVASLTSLTTQLTIDNSAAVGTRTVIATTGTEVATLTDGFTVTMPTLPPVISSVNPNTGQQGQSLALAITGQNTHFVQGSTQVSLGPGITIETLTVVDATHLNPQVTIAASATTGARNVTANTGTEVASLNNAFTVQAAPIISLVNPSSGQQGQSLGVTVTGQNTHFAQGTSQVSFGTGISVTNVTVANATSLTANISIAPDAAAGARAVTVTTGTEVVNLADGFMVNAGTAVLISATPSSGQQGQTLDVGVSGQFTHFVQGTTQLSFGSGITVSQVTVANSTGLAAQLVIAADATVGARTVSATTGTEAAQLTDSFAVTAAPPAVITSVNPNSGQQGQTNLELNITGQNTSFLHGATTVDLGVDITVNSVTVATPTSLTANINIGASASTGTRTITVTTGVQVATLNNGFTVTAAPTGPPLPPDPVTVAPPLDRTVATTLALATEFLYTGDNPIQTGVAPGTIGPVRATVLRGKIRGQDGSPLPAVKITILSHPEFGSTLSRADGAFDMAANGGGLLTVNYEKSGLIPAQRQINAPWQDYAWLPEVVMIPYDSQVTTVDLSANVPMQVAQGSLVADGDGSRQAKLLIPGGTNASLVMPDGTTQAITNLSIRATEFTVGPSGPASMPALLPPTSAYTYAVEYSVDQAVAVGAKEVRFSQPLIHYVENFLGFPVGSSPPTGYYDRGKGAWVPSDNGRVVHMLAIIDGLAVLDVNGSNMPASPETLAALGITGSERQRLAALYTPGQSLWRAPITHFTPWDINWPYLPNCDPSTQSCDPNQPQPTRDDSEDDPCIRNRSVIECQNQILGEDVHVTGTPFSLHYRSNRVPGRRAAYTRRISLSGANTPSSLARIDLDIFVAGQHFVQSFSPLPNQVHTFTWDGRDAYGRTLQGAQKLVIRIGYVYPAVYQAPDEFARSFARYGGGVLLAANRTRQEVTIQQVILDTIGPWDARAQGLGAWSLNVHHAYDPLGRILYLGDGRRRSTQNVSLDKVVGTVVGAGEACNPFSTPGCGDGGVGTEALLNDPFGVATGPDGSVYIADTGNNSIRRLGPDGIVTTVAGTGFPGFGGDGAPAIRAQLASPRGVAVGADGQIYIADTGNSRIRRVEKNGIITTVAGVSNHAYTGDGGPATEAALGFPFGVAAAQDGSVYIADSENNRIRRVGPDGIITTVAGNGQPCSTELLCGDGGPSIQAQITNPNGVAIGPEGSLYIADSFSNRIRRVGPDGIIMTVAGTGVNGSSGDGGLATRALLNNPNGVALGLDGSLYIADTNNFRIRRVGPEGIITTLAGNGQSCSSSLDTCGDRGPAAAVQLSNAWGVTVGPNGGVYIADTFNRRVRQVGSTFPGFSGTDVAIASEDGNELYQFSSTGRHLRTLHTLTGAVLYRFGYDGNGFPTTVTDGDGNVTTIEGDSNGNPVAIVGPYGQRTALTVDGNGYLASVTNPADEARQFAYTAEGLLSTFTDALGNVHRYEYDTLGRLTRDEDPAGGFTTLTHEDFANGYAVNLSTSLGRTTRYQVESLLTGGLRRLNTFPTGPQTELVKHATGTSTSRFRDGLVTIQVLGPDPRWGMQSPISSNQIVMTPGGLVSTFTVGRIVSLAQTNNSLTPGTQTDTYTINGRTYTSAFVGATKTFTTTSPQGRQTTTTIDAQGRIVHDHVAPFNPDTYRYDTRGRLASFTFGSGTDARSASYGYNTDGYLATITDPLGRTESYAYDSAGRVTRQTLADGRLVNYAYDANSNVTSITPPGRPPHIFSFTPVDRVSTYTPPNVGVGNNETLYGYNTDRQLTRMTRPDGQTLDFGYDNAGRLSTLMLPNGQVRFAYDAITGNLATSTTTDGGSLSYEHNGSLPVTLSWSGTISGTVSRTYDDNFRTTSLSVNGSDPITIGSDSDNLLTRAGNLTLTRSPENGFITCTALGNVSDALNHNDFAEPASYSAAYGGMTFYTVLYTRDKLGRITEKAESLAGTSDVYNYTYDQVGRLTGVSKNGLAFSSYSYDSNGNRLSRTGSDGTTNGTYDAQDRLIQYGAATYTYTTNGELTTRIVGGETTTYQYDLLGNLLAVNLPSGTQIEYLVDGENRRIGKKVNGSLVQGFLYQDQLQPIAELDGRGNVISLFVYATRENVPEYMVRGGITYRIITDHLGSPRVVIETSGGMTIQRIDYDEFGNVILDTNPGFQPFGFAGGIYDQHTKLIRFGARDYDAETGRWTAMDPVLFTGGDTNLYGYAFADPVNFIDSTGEIPSWMRTLTLVLHFLTHTKPPPPPPKPPPAVTRPAPGGGPKPGPGGGPKPPWWIPGCLLIIIDPSIITDPCDPLFNGRGPLPLRCGTS